MVLNIKLKIFCSDVLIFERLEFPDDMSTRITVTSWNGYLCYLFWTIDLRHLRVCVRPEISGSYSGRTISGSAHPIISWSFKYKYKHYVLYLSKCHLIELISSGIHTLLPSIDVAVEKETWKDVTKLSLLLHWSNYINQIAASLCRTFRINEKYISTWRQRLFETLYHSLCNQNMLWILS